MHWTYAEYFLGMGAPGKAMQRVTQRHGDTCEFVYGFEIDKYARNAFCAIHKVEEDLIYHDITEQPTELPYVDIVFYSPPCQTFSLAGRQEGTTVDKGNLFYNALEGIKKSNPKFCIMENVANLANQFERDFKNMIRALDELGYVSYNKVLNSKDFGIPQNRERIFVVSIRKDIYEDGHRFEFPLEIPLDLRLKDMLEDEVHERYYLSDKMLEGFISRTLVQIDKGNNFKFEPTFGEGVAKTITECNGQRKTDNFIKVIGHSGTGGERGLIHDTSGIVGALSATEAKQPKQIAVHQVGNLLESDSFGGNPQRGRVYGTDGLCPTLNTVQGGGHMAKILVKSATKAGYEVADVGDSINFEQPKSKTRRGRVGKGVAQTLNTSSWQGIVENTVRIRKLLPIECFRLQGFDDEDYHKAVEAYDRTWKAGASDSQMYKRAGNSITVQVEEEMLEYLLYQRKQVGNQLSFF